MKTMKKAISVLLLVCMVSALCSAGAYADGGAGGTDTHQNTTQSFSFTLDKNTPTTSEQVTATSVFTGVDDTSNFTVTWSWTDKDNVEKTFNTTGTGKPTWNATEFGSGTTISATAKSGNTTLTATPVAVTVVDPNKLTASITQSDNTLTVSAKKGTTSVDITQANVTWSVTDNTNITLSSFSGSTTTVASNNKYAAQTGTVKALVKYNDEEDEATVSVTIAATGKYVTDITISANTNQIVVGNGSVQLNASVTPENATSKLYNWQVTGGGSVGTDNVLHPGSAAVNDTITVKAVAQDGSAKESKELTFTVVAATKSADSINITSSNGNTLIFNGTPNTTTLTAAAMPEGSSINKSTLVWSGSNEYADVNASTGVVTAKKSGGSVTVTAKANDVFSSNKEVTGTYTIEIKAVEPTSVTITEEKVTMELSTTTTPNTKQLTATVLPGNAEKQTIIWSSDNPNVATVNIHSGLVTAVSKGTATITATVQNTNLTDTCTVEVTEPAAYRIVISPNSLNLVPGNIGYFTATIVDKNGNNVSSSDKTLSWSFSGDSPNSITYTDNGYNATNKNYSITVSGRFNRNYNVYASWTDSSTNPNISYKGSASVTVSFSPAIVSGQNAVYNGRDAMSFIVNDAYENFTLGSVWVDGHPLSDIYYSRWSYGDGYLVVTLNQSFLNFLCQYYNNNGYHTISIGTKYGTASGNFRTWGTSYCFNGVKTGDDATPALWAALLAVSAVGAGAAVVIYKRRKTDNG